MRIKLLQPAKGEQCSKPHNNMSFFLSFSLEIIFLHPSSNLLLPDPNFPKCLFCLDSALLGHPLSTPAVQGKLFSLLHKKFSEQRNFNYNPLESQLSHLDLSGSSNFIQLCLWGQLTVVGKAGAFKQINFYKNISCSVNKLLIMDESHHLSVIPVILGFEERQ